jgi:hypothetical protein
VAAKRKVSAPYQTQDQEADYVEQHSSNSGFRCFSHKRLPSIPSLNAADTRLFRNSNMELVPLPADALAPYTHFAMSPVTNRFSSATGAVLSVALPIHAGTELLAMSPGPSFMGLIGLRGHADGGDH